MALGVATNGGSPEITFWTNHGCPWAHRVQIALKELGLSYGEEIIDLDKPRDEWYLKINPRGTVPALRYSDGTIDEIITESAIITQFLADAHPSHLLPASDRSPRAALFRARVNFFVDAFFSKVHPILFAIVKETSAAERERKGDEVVKVVEKELEPLLAQASPFFGGNEAFTLAEALTAPFILRIYDFADNVVYPASIPPKLDRLPNFSAWAKACVAHGSVRFNWESKVILERYKERVSKLRSTSTSG